MRQLRDAVQYNQEKNPLAAFLGDLLYSTFSIFVQYWFWYHCIGIVNSKALLSQFINIRRQGKITRAVWNMAQAINLHGAMNSRYHVTSRREVINTALESIIPQ